MLVSHLTLTSSQRSSSPLPTSTVSCLTFSYICSLMHTRTILWLSPSPQIALSDAWLSLQKSPHLSHLYYSLPVNTQLIYNSFITSIYYLECVILLCSLRAKLFTASSYVKSNIPAVKALPNTVQKIFACLPHLAYSFTDN